MTTQKSNRSTDRRSFIKAGAAAAASLIAGSHLARATASVGKDEKVLWQPSLEDKATLRLEVEDKAANGFVRDGIYTSRMVKGERDGHKWRTRLRDIGLGNREEAALKYEWFIPSNSAADSNDFKMPGLAGLPEGEAGWYTATGGNHKEDSWSFRVHSRSVGTHSEPKRFLEAYLYAQSAGGLRLADFPF